MAELKIYGNTFDKECPVCRNNEIKLRQNYCQICGEPFVWKEDLDNACKQKTDGWKELNTDRCPDCESEDMDCDNCKLIF